MWSDLFDSVQYRTSLKKTVGSAQYLLYDDYKHDIY